MSVPEQDPQHPTTLVGMLSLLLSQLSEVERRILSQITENARVGGERWTAHEQEHKEMVRAIRVLEDRLNSHLEEERNEELVMQARLGPIRTATGLVAREWRTILIVVLIAWNMLQHAADDFLKSLVP